MYNAMLTRKEVQIDGTSFYIAPFPVFTAGRVSAMLTKVLAPVLGGLIAVIGDGGEGETEADETDTVKAIPAFVESLGSLDPLEFERLARELLINSRNIAYKNADVPDGEILTEDTINALFAGNVQNIYILAYHVVKENYAGFFGKLKILSGNATVRSVMEKYGLSDTENSTLAASAI